MRHILPAVASALSAFSCQAQNVLITFPCNGTPNGGSNDKLPDKSPRTVSPDDYYSISIVCLHRQARELLA